MPNWPFTTWIFLFFFLIFIMLPFRAYFFMKVFCMPIPFKSIPLIITCTRVTTRFAWSMVDAAYFSIKIKNYNSISFCSYVNYRWYPQSMILVGWVSIRVLKRVFVKMLAFFIMFFRLFLSIMLIVWFLYSFFLVYINLSIDKIANNQWMVIETFIN